MSADFRLPLLVLPSLLQSSGRACLRRTYMSRFVYPNASESLLHDGVAFSNLNSSLCFLECTVLSVAGPDCDPGAELANGSAD